jgi:hypothetical protein
MKKGAGQMRTAPEIVCIAVLVLAGGSGCQSAAETKTNVGGSGSSPHSGSTGTDTSGGNPGTGGTAALPSASLRLDTATAHVDGRRGKRIRLTLSGEQDASALASIAVTAFDSEGNGLAWFDTDHDSKLDSSTGYLVPKTIPHDPTFSFDLLVPISTALVNWSQAKISLYDRTDAVSNELSVSIEQQPVRASGQACDPTAKADRCQEGLECSSSSNTCVNHTGPSLSQVAYLSTTNGPMLLAAGADNADDVAEMRLAFQDSKGNPALVNVDNNDQNQLASSMTETTGYFIRDGAFLFHIDPTSTFSQIVSKVTFTAVDLESHSSTTLTGALVPAPARGTGASCDYRGFNYCSGNAACVPGTAEGANSCQPLGSAQPAVCKAAQVLDLASSELIVTGYNQGSSLWEPPTDCVSDMGFHHPETVVKLHLASQQASLTLTTDRRETRSDTVLYVATACSPTASQILGCDDDVGVGNVSSTLRLTDVAAGDYYVIVDSMSNDGGPFALTVFGP